MGCTSGMGLSSTAVTPPELGKTGGSTVSDSDTPISVGVAGAVAPTTPMGSPRSISEVTDLFDLPGVLQATSHNDSKALTRLWLNLAVFKLINIAFFLIRPSFTHLCCRSKGSERMVWLCLWFRVRSKIRANLEKYETQEDLR